MQTHPLSAERVFTLISNLQHGSASRTQLQSNGISPDTVDRRLQSGLWVAVAPAIFRSAARPPDWKMYASAAWLEAHRDAVLGGRTSLGMLGFTGAVIPNELPVLLVEHCKTHDSAIASVRQVNGWPHDEIISLPLGHTGHLEGIEPIRCTSVARSLVDIGCWLSSRDFQVFVRLAEQAIRQGFVTCEGISESAEQAKELRRRNVDAVRRWADSTEFESSRVQDASEMELLARRLFLRWGVASRVRFEVPHPAYPGSAKRADAVCDFTGKIFEFDSRTWHWSEAGFQNDRLRDSDAAVEGWTTVRLTWFDLTKNKAVTRTKVRRLCGLDGGVARIAS
jgi:hypothetical protein